MYILPIAFAAIVLVQFIMFTMYQAACLYALLYQVACALYHETAACVFVYALAQNELKARADMRARTARQEVQANAARYDYANFRPTYLPPPSALFRPMYLPPSAPAAA